MDGGARQWPSRPGFDTSVPSMGMGSAFFPSPHAGVRDSDTIGLGRHRYRRGHSGLDVP